MLQAEGAWGQDGRDWRTLGNQDSQFGKNVSLPARPAGTNLGFVCKTFLNLSQSVF